MAFFTSCLVLLVMIGDLACIWLLLDAVTVVAVVVDVVAIVAVVATVVVVVDVGYCC